MALSRRTRNAFSFMGYASFFGTVFPFIFMFITSRNVGIVNHLIAALAVGVVSGPGLTFIFMGLIPFTRRLPFLGALILQLLGFGALGFLGFFVSIMTVGTIRQGLSPLSADSYRGVWDLMTGPLMWIYPWVAGYGLLFIAGAQVSKKLGPGVLWNWIFGKYHHPREEEKVFMFLDVKDSTPLAEKLGNRLFSELIQDFFRDLAYPLHDSGGSVSHYIGDEAVIVWNPKKAFAKGNCVSFFFEMKRELEEKSDIYIKKYGLVPEFKAGIHVGTVVAAEVGVAKSEIVYHGDVVNTTARVVGLCAQLGEDLLVSKAIVDAVPESSGFTFESLGVHALKGKTEPLEIFKVSA